MAIGKVTATDYATALANGVNSRDKTLDATIGPYRDLMIDPVSEVLESQNDRIVYLSNLTSLQYVDRLVPDDVDQLVFNEGLVRWDSSSSLAIVTFARVQAPTVDIVVPVNFPLETVIDPKTGISTNFRTIETQTMYAAAASSYYNATTQKYELDVAVASVTTGAETTLGAYTITQMRRSLAGFDQVYNQNATSAGRAIETNQELSERYLLQVRGSNPSTPDGIKASVLDNFRMVEDVYVVYGTNSYLTREQDDAGAVDVWIQGESATQRTYIALYPGVMTLMQLDRQPVMTIKSVTSGGTTFVEGTDFELVTGESEYSYSTRGMDGIRFLTGGSVPAALGDPVTIVYEYNAVITTLDSYYTQPSRYTIGMDRLFRWAQASYLTLEANLKVRAGNPDTVRSIVRTAVLNYINALKLGDDVEEFDINAVVAQTYGVDNWTYTTLALKDSSGVSDITVEPWSYAQLLDSDFVINLVT